MKNELFHRLILLILGVAAGWFINESLSPSLNTPLEEPLRADGYRFISPLLLCDPSYVADSSSLYPLRDNVQQYIDTNVQSELIPKISVYFRDLNSGEEFNLNQDERYFPASIQKLMMALRLYKLSESNPEILTAKKAFPPFHDGNLGVAVPPEQSPLPGQEYSAEQLIEFMLKYSDNNSFDVLHSTIGHAEYQKIFQELQLQYPESTKTDTDYITPYQISLFFRILYNGTYLNNQNSEKILSLLTQTSYRNALVKNLAPEIPVAHKFGVAALQDQSGKAYGELHDCGIVYKPQNPYIICIMTKSNSEDIHVVEEAIANISSLIYQNSR